MKFTLWILDNIIYYLLSFTLLKNKLKEIDESRISEIVDKEEIYFQARAKIIDFKTSILFDQKSQLSLTTDEINSIYIRKSQLHIIKSNFAEKIFEPIKSYEILNDKLILSDVAIFRIFKVEELKIIAKEVCFPIDNGCLFEKQKIIKYFGEDVLEQNYTKEENVNAMGLIHHLLGCVANENYNESIEKTNRQMLKQEATKVILKIKKIDVRNDRLVISN
jgi:hypothetical protein